MPERMRVEVAKDSPLYDFRTEGDGVVRFIAADEARQLTPAESAGANKVHLILPNGYWSGDLVRDDGLRVGLFVSQTPVDWPDGSGGPTPSVVVPSPAPAPLPAPVAAPSRQRER